MNVSCLINADVSSDTHNGLTSKYSNQKSNIANSSSSGGLGNDHNKINSSSVNAKRLEIQEILRFLHQYLNLTITDVYLLNNAQAALYVITRNHPLIVSLTSSFNLLLFNRNIIGAFIDSPLIVSSTSS